MKKMFWCVGIILTLGVTAQSQTEPKKAKANVSAHSKTVSTKKQTAASTANASSAISLNNTSANSAKANSNRLFSLQYHYTVTDPILTTLDARANGANISFNKSGIIGMPKRAYGFANGHITLKTTGAVTSGTQTGSGAVGTGTSQGTFGSIGASMNVNGKSPYAGINMWGNAMNMMVTAPDSSVRLSPVKKQ